MIRRQAAAGLAALIAKLVDEPVVDAAIEAATARFDYDEQQRLRRRKQDINERLAAMACRNARVGEG